MIPCGHRPRSDGTDEECHACAIDPERQALLALETAARAVVAMDSLPRRAALVKAVSTLDEVRK